jgi:hypothetical protein
MYVQSFEVIDYSQNCYLAYSKHSKHIYKYSMA